MLVYRLITNSPQGRSKIQRNQGCPANVVLAEIAPPHEYTDVEHEALMMSLMNAS